MAFLDRSAAWRLLSGTATPCTVHLSLGGGIAATRRVLSDRHACCPARAFQTRIVFGAKSCSTHRSVVQQRMLPLNMCLSGCAM